MLSFPKANFKIVFFSCVFPVWLFVFFSIAQSSVLCRGEVVSPRLNVRARPSQGARVVMVLNKGACLDVLEIRGGIGDWLHISHGGKTGFVRHRPIYVKVLDHPKKRVFSGTLGKSESRKLIQGRIRREKKRLNQFKGEELALVEGLDEIDRRMDRARKASLALDRENRKLKTNIQGVMDTCQELSQAISKNQTYIEKRLVALHRLHMLGRMDGGNSFFDFIVKQKALKRILEYDFFVFDRQNKDLARVDALEKKLKKQMAQGEKLESELALQIRIQEKESQKKERLLSEIKREKQLSHATLSALERSAALLDQKIKSLEKFSIEKKDYNFSGHKGHLSNPVVGKVISSFGSPKGPDKSFTFQSGIDIKVNRGDPIRSVFKGTIAFSDWLRGYGNLIIIDHGNNYHSLYAHIQDVFKKKGETVKTSEVIATAGDTGSIKGPCLHFEIRHHGRAVNPLKWLKKGT